MELRIERYETHFEEKWDHFVKCDAYNGTLLQTRRFLNYHKQGRFEDYSLIVYKGDTTILAVLPACILWESEQKVFSAHQGSTFGGIIFHKNFYNLQHVEAVLETLEEYLKLQGFQRIVLKQSSQLFATKSNDLLEYFFFQRKYQYYAEISFVIELETYQEDIISNFTANRRRDYRNALKYGLLFRRLECKEEIRQFYDILMHNLQKFEATPVHTYEELVDLKYNRFPEEIDFYGVFQEDEMIAGSMVFLFDERVFHTQYLAARQDKLRLYPNNFMDTNLIMTAKAQGYRFFSFGTSTLEHGSVLNHPLAEFKEGFGTSYSNNKVYYKNL